MNSLSNNPNPTQATRTIDSLVDYALLAFAKEMTPNDRTARCCVETPLFVQSVSYITYIYERIFPPLAIVPARGPSQKDLSCQGSTHSWRPLIFFQASQFGVRHRRNTKCVMFVNEGWERVVAPLGSFRRAFVVRHQPVQLPTKGVWKYGTIPYHTIVWSYVWNHHNVMVDVPYHTNHINHNKAFALHHTQTYSRHNDCHQQSNLLLYFF